MSTTHLPMLRLTDVTLVARPFAAYDAPPDTEREPRIVAQRFRMSNRPDPFSQDFLGSADEPKRKEC
jgi:hypothetical protein